MLKVEDNAIFLTRGDSASLQITLVDESENPYDFSEDVVEFGVKRSALCEGEALLKKTFDEDGKIYFTPEDTENMEFGDYFYDVQVKHINSDEEEEIYTPIAAARFTIGWNVL